VDYPEYRVLSADRRDRRQRLQFARAGAVGQGLGAARLRQPGRNLAHHGGLAEARHQGPQIVRACVELGWEILGHNETNSRWLNQMDAAEERESIARALGKIAALSGRRPKGWLGAGLAETWNTLDHLLDEGIEYVADWVSDDQPFYMDIGGRKLVSIPYSYEINDSPFLQTRNHTIDEFVTAIKRQFDTLYAEGAQSGRVMAICLHPYLIGVPHRIKGLDDAVSYIAAHDGVWFATGSEIVEAWKQSGATF
jgi:allantoinase